MRTCTALLFAWLMAGPALAAPMTEANFHSKVVELYSFEPHKLTSAEMTQKSAQLDRFWELVKGDPDTMLPLLRKELADASNSAFFFYDGSKLLLSLSKDRSDLSLALRSIPKADLQGVEHTDYLKTVHWFASNGFDTREAAFRILAFPDFKAFIPQHVLTLGQNYALIYMLFPMEEKTFLGDLAGRLSSERNVESQKSLLLALWYTATPTANAAIQAFADDQGRPPTARNYAKALLSRKGSGFGFLSLQSSESLRRERQKVMQRPISDEALIEFDALTTKLLAAE